MQIKYATKDTLKLIAKCHELTFNDSLSSKMGVSFIADMFKWYLSDANKFLFYIEENDTCIGYCGGYYNDGKEAYGSASGMTQMAFGTAIKSLLKKPWLLFHPDLTNRYRFIIRNIARKFSLVKEKSIVNQNSLFEPYAGLVVIGVLPSFQKKGIGSMLQIEFEKKAKSLGANIISLSVKKDNVKAIKSYERNGYTISSDNTPVYTMQKNINIV